MKSTRESASKKEEGGAEEERGAAARGRQTDQNRY